MAAAKKGAGRVRAAKTPQEVQDDLDSVSASASSKAVGTKEKERLDARKKEVTDATSSLDLKGISTKTTELSLELSRKLQEIVSEVQTQGTTLNEIREAIKLEREALEEIYGKDTVLRALDQLVAEYNAKKLSLEQEIEAKKKEWEEEQITKDKANREAEFALAQQRNRANADYEYSITLSRRRAEDAFQSELDSKKRAESVREAELKKSWADREAQLAKDEKELTDLRAFKAGNEEVVRKASTAAAAAAVSAAVRDAQHKFDLEKKDLEARLSISQSTEASLREQIESYKSTVAKLQADVAAANTKNAELAQAALSGAARERAISDLAQISINSQQNGTPQGKRS